MLHLTPTQLPLKHGRHLLAQYRMPPGIQEFMRRVATPVVELGLAGVDGSGTVEDVAGGVDLVYVLLHNTASSANLLSST